MHRLAGAVAILAILAVSASAGVSASVTSATRGVVCTVQGGSSDDLLAGGKGRDVICARDGKDYLAGNGNRDTLNGGQGDDALVGGHGPDRLSGGDGTDHIFSVDGKGGDVIRGGPGEDFCYFDKGDVIHGCEKAYDPPERIANALSDAFFGAVKLGMAYEVAAGVLPSPTPSPTGSPSPTVAPSPIPLGTASSFALLAGQGVTNTGATVITGDLGTAPNPAITGFPPGIVNGTIFTADAVALQAQSDLTTAYTDASGLVPTMIGTQLGGQTLVPGVYASASGTFEIAGTLTLDALGDPGAAWVFQTASTLVTATQSVVAVVDGARACNVFWQVGSSATLGTYSVFRGNVFALQSIQVQTGVSLVGRVLARNASVTLDTDLITRACDGSA